MFTGALSKLTVFAARKHGPPTRAVWIEYP